MNTYYQDGPSAPLLKTPADSSLLTSSEALPFFLLLIDLSKACALAKFALSSSSQVGHTVDSMDCVIPHWNSAVGLTGKWHYLFIRMK